MEKSKEKTNVQILPFERENDFKIVGNGVGEPGIL